MPVWHTYKVEAIRLVEFTSPAICGCLICMHAHMPYMRRESPISKLNEQWTCADELPNVKNKTHKGREI